MAASKQKYKIRLARITDRDWIRDEIYNDSYSEEKLDIVGSSYDYLVDINDSYKFTLIVEYNKKPVGFVSAKYIPLSRFDYLGDIYVIKKHRGKGVGKLLIREAMKKCKRDFPAIGMYAITIENEPMERLLGYFSFKEIGHIKEFVYRDGEHLDQKFMFVKYGVGL